MYHELIQPEDTIVAIATAQGIGAIGVIRVSGTKAFEICDKIFKGKSIQLQASHTIQYGHIMNGTEIVDEVMIAVFRSPKSFTTEDSVEISCHGSVYIQSQIINLLLKHGARLAAPGEFTLRAYLNGRIDLAQAEAVGDIIASQNQSQLNIAMHQMRGGLSSQLNKLREDLLNFISLVELELDFGEEDVEFADRTELKNRVEQMHQFILPMINSFQLGNAIKNGIPVAIVGRPNAGKSSLLNALLEDDRAIVSDIAGTTRDTIEEEIHINGVSFRFIDTAGIRQTTDVIENIGIDKAIQSISKAQIVICIFDMSNTSIVELSNDIEIIKKNNGSAHLLVIGNKKDVCSSEQIGLFENYLQSSALQFAPVSMLNRSSSDTRSLRQILYDIMQLNGIDGTQTIISNARHHQQLLSASEALLKVLELLQSGNSGDILSFEMRRAVDAIGDITGTISNDEVLGNIFGKFCIGK